MIVAARLRADVRVAATSGAPRLRPPVHVVSSAGGAYFAEDYLTDPSSYVTEPFEDAVRADVTVDGSVSAAARPRAGEVQVVGWRLLIDGVEFDARWLIESWSLERSFEGASLSFRLATRSDLVGPAARNPLGTPFGYAGAIPGKAAIDFEGIYVTSTGFHTVRLLTAGISDSSTRTATAGGGSVDDLQVIDRLGRHDRRKVTLSLPPGHGLTRGEVIRRLAAAAGVSSFRLAAGNRMHREIQLVDVDWIGPARELADTENRALLFDTDGDLHNPRLLRPDSEEADFVFLEGDIVRFGGDTAVSGLGDIPTAITLTGTEQVLRPECGLRTEISVVETFANFAPEVAAFKQDGAGNLTATGATSVASFQLVSRVTTIQEYECDTLISERVKTEGWFNPRHARYFWNAGGTALSYEPNVYVKNPNAVKDDNSQAYLWARDRFVLISDILTEHRYDERGFETVTETRSGGWLMRRADVKSRILTSTTWESLNHTGLRSVLGSGEGVVDSVEQFKGPYSGASSVGGGGVGAGTGLHEPERITTTREISDDGYVLREDTITEQWAVRPGSLHLYHGAEEAAAGSETFQQVAREIVTNLRTSENGHQRITQSFDFDGRLVEMLRERQDGDLPAAERKESLEPDSSIYNSDAEAEAAAAASRLETQEWKIQCGAPALEAHHEKNEIKQSVPWAESPEEGASVCVRMLREGTALQARITLPCNWLVREGRKYHARVPQIDLDHDIHSRRVRWFQSRPGGPIVTNLEGLVLTI